MNLLLALMQALLTPMRLDEEIEAINREIDQDPQAVTRLFPAGISLHGLDSGFPEWCARHPGIIAFALLFLTTPCHQGVGFLLFLPFWVGLWFGKRGLKAVINNLFAGITYQRAVAEVHRLEDVVGALRVKVNQAKGIAEAQVTKHQGRLEDARNAVRGRKGELIDGIAASEQLSQSEMNSLISRMAQILEKQANYAEQDLSESSQDSREGSQPAGT